MDGKQVAVLALPQFWPAALSYICQPFRDFPLLYRYSAASAPKRAKEISNLEEGNVDVIIGTHRLLSKDVKFRDLGLLIIDEEQRFGVGHKEIIKQMKKNIDVLTSTATPIPVPCTCLWLVLGI